MYKKTILVATLVFCTFGAAFAQRCKIDGNISGFKEKSFLFAYNIGQQDEQTDTIYVKDGKFSWSGNFKQPQECLLYLPEKTILIFIDPGAVMQINGNADSLAQLKITGSKSQADCNAYKELTRSLYTQISALNLKINSANTGDKIELTKQLDELNLQVFEIGNQFIRKHPNSFFNLWIVGNKEFHSYTWAMESFNMLGKILRNSPGGKDLANRLVMLKRRQLGEYIPDFVQNNPDGKPVKLSDFKGKYVLIDFWASSCAPCRAQNPNLLKAYNQFKINSFTIIGVSLDDHKASWVKAINDDHMPWAQVSDLKGWKNRLSSYYGIGSIPSNLLVDPSGKVIAKDLRDDELYKTLAALFKGKG